jgi:hypothetical protein
MRNFILDWLLGPAFDSPFPAKRQPDNVDKKVDNEPGLHRTPTKGVPVREVDDFEWEVAKDRNPTITDADKREVDNTRTGKPVDRLKIDKYRELKPLWADGQSSAQVARLPQYKDKHGYGQRTIEKYWAAMYRAHLNPSPEGKAKKAPKVTESVAG